MLTNPLSALLSVSNDAKGSMRTAGVHVYLTGYTRFSHKMSIGLGIKFELVFRFHHFKINLKK